MGNVFACGKIFKWSIEGYSSIKKNMKSKYYSGFFEALGYRWHLKLEKRDNCIALELELDKSTTFPPNSGVNVEFTLRVMDQVKGNHKKRIDQFQICSKFITWKWPNFLHLEDLQNPSNGFLVNDTCIVEASIAVLGSFSYHDF
ncbi:putative Ubiquitin carboxyl-terminal hydrolase 12 [Cocos nucifera]|uniref:Putative Ubiquitin carboxyl-terminal hydrolase 12 n=1 Tax=Cocos nucifera TaxID=13894 RepID=A0A8K0I6B9_COCNU|nr:putative Ubiquitin carboxyl-terminal hydrolase 12 [Cocos nucifera]